MYGVSTDHVRPIYKDGIGCTESKCFPQTNKRENITMLKFNSIKTLSQHIFSIGWHTEFLCVQTLPMFYTFSGITW